MYDIDVIHITVCLMLIIKPDWC